MFSPTSNVLIKVSCMPCVRGLVQGRSYHLPMWLVKTPNHRHIRVECGIIQTHTLCGRASAGQAISLTACRLLSLTRAASCFVVGEITNSGQQCNINTETASGRVFSPTSIVLTKKPIIYSQKYIMYVIQFQYYA